MKRYTVIDNKTDRISHYTNLEWNLAWWGVWLMGIGLGIMLSNIF
jgi:hypothetical protein